MNQFLRIRSYALTLFFMGVGFGFVTTLVVPEIGRHYFAFQLQQVEQFAGIHQGVSANLWMAMSLFLRNLSIAFLIALLPLVLVYQTLAYRKRYPYKSSDYHAEIRKELHLTLTMYSTAVLVAYGFFVFGIFLAYIFIQDSFHGLMIWILYLVPHGVLEISAMIIAASTGIVIRDSWLNDFDTNITSHWRRVSKRNYATCLIILTVVLLASAFLEVYISRQLMKTLISVT
jgi:Stage II sporulation protein M